MGTAARRIGYVIAGAGAVALAAFVSAAPAYADNGPHVAASGTTAMAASPDSCAGCHRAHSGKVTNYLFVGGTDQEAFCETCHDGTAATTNTKDGVSTKGTTVANTALRAGGFQNTRMGTSSAVLGTLYYNTARASWSKSRYGDPQYKDAAGNSPIMTVPVLAAGVKVTSTHQLGEVTQWGSGATPTGVGAKVELECSSCHNPHGNGNFRILNPVGSSIPAVAGTAVSIDINKQFAKVVNAASADDTFGTEQAGAARYIYTFTTDKAHTFTPGMVATVRTAGAAPATTYLARGTITSVTATTFSVGYQTAKPTWVNGAVVANASVSYPSSILKAEVSGTDYVFQTAQPHGLYVGQKVQIASMNASASDFMGSFTITAVPTLDSFKVAGTKTPASVGTEVALYIVGIPDAVATTDTTGPGVPVGVTGFTKVYTTDNYTLADDHYYSGKYQSNAAWTDATGAAKKYTALSGGFIANVSQWCATCHTRYLASSNSRRYAYTVEGKADAQFTFRHRSDYVGEASPNCITCHVAHGSSAQMTGSYSSAMTVPGTTTASNSSRLLRVDNRGICVTCHTP